MPKQGDSKDPFDPWDELEKEIPKPQTPDVEANTGAFQSPSSDSQKQPQASQARPQPQPESPRPQPAPQTQPEQPTQTPSVDSGFQDIPHEGQAPLQEKPKQSTLKPAVPSQIKHQIKPDEQDKKKFDSAGEEDYFSLPEKKEKGIDKAPETPWEQPKPSEEADQKKSAFLSPLASKIMKRQSDESQGKEQAKTGKEGDVDVKGLEKKPSAKGSPRSGGAGGSLPANRLGVSDGKKPKRWIKEVLKFGGIFAGVFVIIFVVLNWPSIAVNLKYWWETNRGGDDTVAEETNIDVSLESPENIPEGDRIMIGKIKVDAPIVFSKDIDDKVILEDLKSGVVHYPGTAMPGETGNCFITGHSSNYWWVKSKYNTVFTLLPKLVVGDKVVVYYKQKKYIYEVKDVFEVDPNQTDVLNPTEKPTLTLMTCVPIGTNLKRLIVKAEQISPSQSENVDLNRPRLPGE